MGSFSLHIIYIIDLLTPACLATEMPCLCLTSETASLSGFFVHHCFILLADWRRGHLSNTNCCRGKPFFKRFGQIQTYEKIFAEFSFL